MLLRCDTATVRPGSGTAACVRSRCDPDHDSFENSYLAECRGGCLSTEGYDSLSELVCSQEYRRP